MSRGVARRKGRASSRDGLLLDLRRRPRPAPDGGGSEPCSVHPSRDQPRWVGTSKRCFSPTHEHCVRPCNTRERTLPWRSVRQQQTPLELNGRSACGGEQRARLVQHIEDAQEQTGEGTGARFSGNAPRREAWSSPRTLPPFHGRHSVPCRADRVPPRCRPARSTSRRSPRFPWVAWLSRRSACSRWRPGRRYSSSRPRIRPGTATCTDRRCRARRQACSTTSTCRP